MVEEKRGSSELKKIILEKKKIIKEISSLFAILERTRDSEEREMISSQINLLEDSLKKRNNDLSGALRKISLVKPLGNFATIKGTPQAYPETFFGKMFTRGKDDFLRIHDKQQHKSLLGNFAKSKSEISMFPSINSVKTKKIESNEKEMVKVSKKGKIKLPKNFLELEKETLKRLGNKEKKIIKNKVKKPSKYVKIANRIFINLSKPLSKKKIFDILKTSLIKSNMQFIPLNYISIILFTTLLSVIFSIFVFGFFLFFNFGPELPIITKITEDIGTRFLKIFWILFVIPLGTISFMYFYPSIERRAIENRINHELPFATIHMSAISGSMVEPSKIFSIVNSTGEYPNISKEFTKLINEINVYGYNLVSALRNLAFNCPSSKLSELFNGLASTISSGGDIQDFFEKRAQSLLFEYKIENENRTKMAETFMDIYISVVIAAPMIFMLVLMMMKISGLGISLSTSMISLIMVLGVAMMNIVFLTFLHLKQPGE
ncbi:type II secretion system F family protein [Candidatus Pacearchaeota archaeon]|nr:type II secretion system F family protein [Candidatus Pacearchaeota archaeon]